jgi:hypothetical protein
VFDQAFTELLSSHASIDRSPECPSRLGSRYLSWALPVHAAQARLSPPMPIPLGFCSAVLAVAVISYDEKPDITVPPTLLALADEVIECFRGPVFCRCLGRDQTAGEMSAFCSLQVNFRR